MVNIGADSLIPTLIEKLAKVAYELRLLREIEQKGTQFCETNMGDQ